MILYNNSIDTKIVNTVLDKYKVTKKDIDKYLRMIEDGDVEKATDLFVEEYLVKPTEGYNDILTGFLAIADQGELSEDAKRKLERSISLFSYGLNRLLSVGFGILLAKLVGSVIFKDKGITTAKVKNAVLGATLSRFNEQTEKALLSTQANVLKNIRQMQKEMIIFNQTSGKALSGKQLEAAIQRFTSELQKKFPEYYKLKDGKLFASSPYGPNNAIRYYKMHDYIAMSARTTLLNVGRYSTEISVLVKEGKREAKGRIPVRVVKYLQVDFRPLKTGIEREICKDILSDKAYGLPLLALDQYTADLLGIMSIDDARSDGAMGPFCRHGIEPVSVLRRKKLERIIKTKIKEAS